MNSKHPSACQFELKWILFSTISNLFRLEVVQKCQYCQLCVLRENSTQVAFSQVITAGMVLICAKMPK